MAITAYTGVPGSGKSYALVAEVILPALQKGRRVVSNVDGLRVDAIRDYCLDRSGTAGELVLFDGRDTLMSAFWPSEGNAQSKLKPGDLLVMDEVRLYWPPSGKFPPFITAFLRFHRHWVADDGTSTDIVLASQVLTDFHREYRGLLERSYKFKKLSTLGLNSRYVWNMWEGGRQVAREVAGKGGGSYKPEVFDLYSSFKGGAAGESKATDKRANVLASRKLWILAAGCVTALAVCAYVLVDFFSGPETAKKPEPAVEQEADRNPYGATGPGTPIAGRQAVAVGGPPEPSTDWRIAGVIDAPTGRRVVLANASGAVRLESPSVFFFDQSGQPVSGVVDGKTVVASLETFPAGSASSSGIVSAPR